MNELLSRVLRAHGGLDNWTKVAGLTARLSLGGPFWAARGWPGIYDQATVDLDAHREHIVFKPFAGSERRSVLDVGPERVAVETVDGHVIDERTNPRATYPMPFTLTTPWDELQVAYFGSYAMWNYLTTPFLLTYPGVAAQEIAPWQEDDETWHRLQVTFPATIATHNHDQIYYFDADCMLRRLDYSPDVTGSPPIAHYVRDHREFDGFVFATRRDVYLHDQSGIADKARAVITIAIENVAVRMAEAVA